MLPVVVWLGVYALSLYTLGQLVAPWRDRSWFKVLFFPGTLIASGLQWLAASLCVTGCARAAPFADRKPAFGIETKKVPCLGGALFVFVSHLSLYTLFFFVVMQLDVAATLEAETLYLPMIETREVMSGRLDIDAREYCGGIASVASYSSHQWLVASGLLYIVAGVFVSLRVSGKQCNWFLTLLGILAVLTYIGDWLGLGFAPWTRGFWADFSSFWAFFSIYMTVLLLTLASFGVLRGIPALSRRSKSSKGAD